MALEHVNIPTRHKHTAVALFDRRDEVVAAVRALHRSGFSNDQISLLAKDDTAVGETIREVGVIDGSEIEPADVLAEEIEPKGRDEMAGMAIGGTMGFVIGFAALAIPGFGGFLLAAGPFAIALHSLTTSAAGLGLGALLGAIFDERVTEEHRDLYKRQLEGGRWILVVHGENDEIERAAGYLRGQNCSHVDAF